MADERPTLLMVEDDLGLQKQMRWSFDRYNVIFADNREAAVAQLRRHEPLVATLDLGLPPDPDTPNEGFKTLEEILALAPATKVIALTGQNDRGNALRAIGMGAYDFFAKPFEPDVLGLVIDRAFRLADLEQENRRLSESVSTSPLSGLLTRDPGMLKICRQIERLAPTNATVLLLGESGTGKEVLARGLHQLSPRHDKRFVAINCAAIPETLLESELFGYEKGAFTDARQQKRGIFELADRGTLFLDEIGEIPLMLQAKLLRVLEEQCFRRLGGLKDIQLDLRVVAATNKNLREAVQEGAFRQDLYFRLNVIHITIPPLRERPEDIMPLVRYFIDHYNSKFKRRIEGVTPEAEKLLLAHDWPGNVRELRNAIERAMILEEGTHISTASLPIAISRGAVEPATVRLPAHEIPDEGLSLEENEKQLIIRALEKTKGNQTQAARLLKITRDTLRYKIKKFNLR